MFDPATGKAGGKLVVDATGGSSDNGARGGHRHKSTLESARNPEIAWAPDRVDGKPNPAGDSETGRHGTLTLHGGAREASLTAKSHLEPGRISAGDSLRDPGVSWGMQNPGALFPR